MPNANMTDGEAAKLWAARKQQQYPHAEALFANPKLKKISIWEALTNDANDASLVDAAVTFVCEVQKNEDAGILIDLMKTYNPMVGIVVLVPSNHALRTIPQNSTFTPADYVIQVPAGNKLKKSAQFSIFTTASKYVINIKLENNKIIIANSSKPVQTLRVLNEYTVVNGTIYIVDGVYKNDGREKALKTLAAYAESEGILKGLTSGSLSKATAYNALTIPDYNNKKLIETAASFMALVKSENNVRKVLSSSAKPITVFVPRNEAFPKRGDRADFIVQSHILLGENVKDILKLSDTPFKTLKGNIQISYVPQKLGSLIRKRIHVDYANEDTQSIVILDKYAIKNGTIYIIDQLIRGYDSAAAAAEPSTTPQDLPNVYPQPLPQPAVGTYTSEPGYTVKPKF